MTPEPGTPPPSPSTYAHCGDAELAETLRRLCAAEMEVHAEKLAVLAELGRRQAVHRAEGCSTFEQWIAAAGGVRRSTARLWAREARALEGAPALRGLACEGRLSHDQLAAATKIVGSRPDLDATLAAHAPDWSLRDLERVARTVAGRPPAVTEAEAFERRFLAFSQDAGQIRIRGALPTAEGAVVANALREIAGKAVVDETGALVPHAARLADALVSLSARSFDDLPVDHLARVSVHVDVAALIGDPGGSADVEGFDPVAVETARRLACDAGVGVVVENEMLEPIRFGRTRRRVTCALRRMLAYRDQGCRFPHCGRTLWTHAHHLDHWADGGATDPDNLVLLCETHHRFVHEGRWAMTMDDRYTVTFTSPDGRVLTSLLPPLSPLVRRRLFAERPPPPPAPGGGGGDDPPGCGPPHPPPRTGRRAGREAPEPSEYRTG